MSARRGYDYTVLELKAGLRRMIEANGEEMDYYNSNEAMAKMDVLQRTAIIKSIGADNRWINFVLYNIEEGEKFLAQNEKAATP
jgi:hypothetical protein